jgi:hypothetical protein
LPEALPLFQEVGDAQGIGTAYYYLADSHMLNRDLSLAGQLWEQGDE